MNMLAWIRIGAGLAGVIVLWLAFKALTGHYVKQGVATGRAEVQSKWDAKNLADANAAHAREIEARAEENRKRINAERIADEQGRQEKARAARLNELELSARGMRDAIAKLDADDLSSAAADPRVAAIAQRAVTARGLLASCQARYGELAATTNRVRDQAAGLLDFTLTVCRPAPVQN